MREIKGNLWDFHAKGSWIVITTNGTVRADGECVMGRGIAAQARSNFPKVGMALGKHIKAEGNNLCILDKWRLIAFPVKHNWWEIASGTLIVKSARKLAELPELNAIPTPIYMPRPGCGNGGLRWAPIRGLLEPILDDRFVVVEYK